MSRGQLGGALALAALLTAAWPTGAPAHPGHAIPMVKIGGFAYTPQTINVVQGDFVQWKWSELDRNHSVTSDAGQAESFDSDPGESPAKIAHPLNDTFTYFFARAGTFTYHCKVHSYMHGTVVVKPYTPPLPDTTPPRLRFLHVSRRAHHRLHIRYRLSESATVVIRLNRVGSRRVLRRQVSSSRGGVDVTSISMRGLRRGRYRLTGRAKDAAGNLSHLARGGFRLGRAG